MISFDIKNLQGIEEAHIVVEDNSINEFTGDNSNGKSIISKILKELLSGDIRDAETRIPLIKDFTTEGALVITHNTKQLGILLREDIKNCFVMYTPNVAEPDKYVLRCMNDWEGCKTLVHRFGFRVYAKGDICLQLSPTWGPIPFITTSGLINGEIVDDITHDKFAEEFLNSFSNITFPLFREQLKSLKKERDSMQLVLDNLESYDWRVYEDLAERMKVVYNSIRNYDFITIENIEVPPNVDIIPIQQITINNLPIITCCDYGKSVSNLDKELSDLLDILNGVCPTCGKPLIMD